ncbi:MAG: hypothetical protein CBC00_02740 [Verrucomicrobia bacterium TMED40]|nr:MAG: hypothetical protein CBC00_02740 [Verrucomicrobia bacterium TMED40]
MSFVRSVPSTRSQQGITQQILHSSKLMLVQYSLFTDSTEFGPKTLGAFSFAAKQLSISRRFSTNLPLIADVAGFSSAWSEIKSHRGFIKCNSINTSGRPIRTNVRGKTHELGWSKIRSRNLIKIQKFFHSVRSNIRWVSKAFHKRITQPADTGYQSSIHPSSRFQLQLEELPSMIPEGAKRKERVE